MLIRFSVSNTFGSAVLMIKENIKKMSNINDFNH